MQKFFSKMYLGSFLLGAIPFISAMLYMVWRVNGGHFLPPPGAEIITFDRWSESEQFYFMLIIIFSVVATGIGYICAITQWVWRYNKDVSRS